MAAHEKAITLNGEHPYPHHNRADLLFRLGRYKEGWQEWRIARDRYESFLLKASGPAKAEAASYFGGLLTEVFGEYETAEQYYREAIAIQNYDAATWRGLVGTYQKWAEAREAPPDIQVRLSYALKQAVVLTRRRLEEGSTTRLRLALADLHLGSDDRIEARTCLAEAVLACQGSRLERAEIHGRQGLLAFHTEKYDDAVESFRRASAVRPEDLELQCNLGKAMFRAKNFGDAQRVFSKVLKSAPGQVDALVGAAQVLIELAEEGETEHLAEAESRLSEALHYGLHADIGSIRLSGSRLDEVYYMRGYVRTKRWEADGRVGTQLQLLCAYRDFRQCKQHPQAYGAKKKIQNYLGRRARESRVRLGELMMACAAALVFLCVQIDFFFNQTRFHGLLTPRKGVDDPLIYATLTFGALLFMIASLYLPNLLKFKVAGIELEKAATPQVAPPSSLGIKVPSTFKDS